LKGSQLSRRRPKTEAGTRPDSQSWVRNAADEKAVAAGMRFSPERARFVCDWIESCCHIYEGDMAGEPLTLLPFQRDFFSRSFGWVRWSDEWGGWVRRFTHLAFWAAKKNGKTPLCAAFNLYLMAGDGEAGQKVYQAAKNGDQARIAQRHAIEMVKQSPGLMADCKINNSTMQITHLPSSSILMILTGDDSRGAKAKEGLNGSVSFDEMHVVDREMFERVSRAGISRRQPFIASFSTAGDDPSSVGHERCVYGRQVNSGERDDPTFLHVEYAAGDGISEAEIDARLDDIGKAANPAWGTLVKPSEFRADWNRSKGNQREVARFLQYRANRWVGSTNAWLDAAAWGRSGDDYTPDDLRGRSAFAALDLSRTRDLTAFVLMFPWPEDGAEAVRLWPLFWMPEETAKNRDHLFPFLSWAKGGAIKLTQGAVVDYSVVKADVRELIAEYDILVDRLYYDKHLANEITQALHEGETLGGASVPGVVGERVEFAQSLMTFTGPAKEFERRVSAGLVRHPRNPVLTWQVGHCEVWGDRNQNIRPVKPAPHSGKSVDGVVCAVMATTGVMQVSAGPSVYESRGVLLIGGEDPAPVPAPDAEPEEKNEPVSWVNDDHDDDDRW